MAFLDLGHFLNAGQVGGNNRCLCSIGDNIIFIAVGFVAVALGLLPCAFFLALDGMLDHVNLLEREMLPVLFELEIFHGHI